MQEEVIDQIHRVQLIFEELSEAMQKLEIDFNSYIAWEQEREMELCANAREQAD